MSEGRTRNIGGFILLIMAEGWIKIHRSLSGKGWYNRPDYVALWIHILMKANHKTIEYYWNGKTIYLKAGQFICGRRSLSQETGVNESKLERILKCFESEQQIEQQKTSTSRLISIINYKKYQQSEQQIEQRVNNERTASEQRVNTKEELKNNKNDKNEKKEKDFWDLIFDEFVIFRKEIKKPLTEASKIRWVENLQKLSQGKEFKAKEIVNQSIAQGWQGLFEIKTKQNGKSESEPTYIDGLKQWYDDNIKPTDIPKPNNAGDEWR